MATNAENGGRRRGNRWRMVAWGAAAALLLLPLLAMQVTDQVDWNLFDFAVAGALAGSAGGAYELAARMTGNSAYRAGVGVALAAAFILVWMNLAVGIIGSEDNPANLMFGVVLGVGMLGAAIGRFRPEGMARAMNAAALAQALAGGTALIAGLGSVPHALSLSAFFAALWLVSARLFRKAARQRARAGEAAA